MEDYSRLRNCSGFRSSQQDSQVINTPHNTPGIAPGINTILTVVDRSGALFAA